MHNNKNDHTVQSTRTYKQLKKYPEDNFDLEEFKEDFRKKQEAQMEEEEEEFSVSRLLSSILLLLISMVISVYLYSAINRFLDNREEKAINRSSVEMSINKFI